MAFTNPITGSGFDDGFQVGIDEDGFGQVNQKEDLPMIFSTNSQENMRIDIVNANIPGGAANRTRISIPGTPGTPVPSARAMLHMGDGDTGGHRNWMDVGTYLSGGSDQMYVGLQKYSDDNYDAVINWGDNFMNDDIGPNRLRFIFTAPQATQGGAATSSGGKEIAFMTYEETVARVGIETSTPKAKLHIMALPPAIAQPVGGEDPYLHLRLSRMTIAGDANSDFKTTPTGNLMINTYMASGLGAITEGNVGIGLFVQGATTEPMRRLDVLDNAAQQLRLSYSVDQSYTDFHNTAIGDLLIQPSNKNVGINLTAVDPPTHSLDVNGQARVRSLLPGTNKGLVCYDANGVLRPLDLPNDNSQVLHGDGTWGAGAGDHDWYAVGTTDPPTSINQSIYTFNNVGIGILNPSNGFLDVRNNNIKTGINCITLIPSWGATTAYNGIYGEINNVPYQYSMPVTGVKGIAYGNKNKQNIGVWGHAQGGGVGNVGVYGTVQSGEANGNAGLFIGSVRVNGNLYVTGTYPGSDQILKENVQDIPNSLDLIAQLNPKSFEFRVDDYPQFNLQGGTNFGFIAQEVEAILPDLVLNATSPAQYDSDGNLLYDDLNYKCVNYNAFISILMQGIKDQQEMLLQYENRLNDVENQLTACCNQNKTGEYDNEVFANAIVNKISDDMLNVEDDVLFRNYPNPFSNSTTFAYKLAEDGNVQLEVISATGRHIATLVSEGQLAGSYSVYWETSDIAQGVYYFSLKVDGLEWIRKAVKIK